MSRDEFKTQVLLLHKEQSALDHLSSGFNDSYTVHCATSGSEALNTLVETPINVIISAQDLPGMSGLEALREAKKRSPETIGILLADTSDDGLETLVGDKEVFQVVRGNVTNDSLLKLVDTATQQLRLMALAESANDTAADVDEPSAQHIVMETSENGATIISDGTGQMQALHAAKGSALGSRSVDLLALTRDPDFLSTVKASSRGMHTVHYATTLAQAVETIREHKVGVAVVDAAMVGDRVEQLTQHLRQVSPRLVSIVAGRREDGEMLMDLINRGKVYRFLLKPVSPGRARLAVDASIKHHLEAPDAAFTAKNRIVPSPSATPALKATPQTVPEPEPEPESTAERKVEHVPEPQPELDQDSSVNVAPSPDSLSDLSDVSSVDNKLADSLNGDDSNSTGTVSELVSAVAEDLGTVEDLDESMEVAGLPESALPPAAAKSGRWSGLGLGGVAIIVAGAVVFWFVNSTDVAVTGDESPVDEPAATEAEVILGAPGRDTDRVDGDAGVDNPPVVDDAQDVVDLPGDEALIDETLKAVETALLESRLDDASAALQRVSSADPDNARLPFLAAQLSQMRLLEYLSIARTAIRDSRFEDASAAIELARSLNLPDGTEIDAIDNELNAARSEQRAEDVLAKGNARLSAGKLLEPPNDNARYYFDLALSIDPRNAAARQGLSVIASKLSLRARSETENGSLDSAEDLLSEAYVLDPENSELAAAVEALSNKRDAIAAERRREEEQRRAAEKRAAAERKAAEERAAAERKAAEERAAAQAAAVAPVKETAELPAEDPASAKGIDATSDDAAATREDAATAETATADEGTTTVADEKPGQESETTKSQEKTSAMTPGSVSALNRIKYVAPKYPRAAQRRNLSGWVDVVFTVTTDGTVKDIAIPKSEPGDTFVNAATKAVEKWLFEPVVENGTIVEKRVGVRMMFALE